MHTIERKTKSSVMLLVVGLCGVIWAACEEKSEMQWSSPPAMEIDTGKSYRATIELEKNDGVVEVELFADKVPNIVNNFVFLARQGYYDNVTFHRVIEGFMAQTGDPTGTGRGDPGYKIDNEFHPDLRHDGPGVLSMANSGARGGKGTNGSQFFITYTATGYLDGLNPDGSAKDCSRESCHPVFGQVAKGMENINAVSPRDPGSAKVDGDKIKTITIVEE